MHLTGDDLDDLEQVLRKDSTNEQLTFSFKKDGFEYSSDSVQDFVQKVDLPDIAKEYEFHMRCEEGKIRIDADKLYSGGKLRISGDTDWVHKKERQISEFLDKYKNRVRTHSTKIIGATYALEIFAWLVFSTTSTGGEISFSLFEGFFIISAFIAIIGWPYALIGIVAFVYPYHLIKRDESVKYQPGLSSFFKYTLILLSIIGGIGGIVSLIRFLK